MSKIDRNKLLYALAIIFVLGMFWGWYGFIQSRGTNLSVSGTEEVSIDSDPSETEQIIVHITGAVNKPGIVTLDKESRMAEAVEGAGGLTETADGDAINLARKLKDEEKIIIPEKGEETKASDQGDQGLININTANLEELKSLPGVGDVIAQGIIDYRKKNGDFTQLEELKNVTRIGDKIFQGFSELITL